MSLGCIAGFAVIHNKYLTGNRTRASHSRPKGSSQSQEPTEIDDGSLIEEGDEEVQLTQDFEMNW